MERLLAIDPGNIESGYVLVEYEGGRVRKILDAGKVGNSLLMYKTGDMIRQGETNQIVIELIESFGMPVGREVFQTCIWIGRFIQHARDNSDAQIFSSTERESVKISYITRREEKLTICGSVKAKDSNIRQALIDKYAEFDWKNGKGTKAKPDFFYGFKADMWAAFAVAHTFIRNNVKINTSEDDF